MLTHLMVGRAAVGHGRPNLKAHANFSCRVHSLGRNLINGWNALFAGIRKG